LIAALSGTPVAATARLWRGRCNLADSAAPQSLEGWP
jgi:hypothetical protein